MEPSAEQRKVLAAIADTFVAPLTATEIDQLNDRYAASDSTDYAHYSGATAQPFTVELIQQLRPEKQQQLYMVLNVLATKAGTFALTGHMKKFTEIPQHDREKILLRWRDSKLPPLNLLFKTFSVLCIHSVYRNPDCVAFGPMGYTSSHEEPTAMETLPERLPMLDTVPSTVDVIVVGSGAGGGVCAAELSKAGYSVLVLEKGKYYHESEFVLNERTGFINLLDEAGFLITEDGKAQVLAGSTFGGGTAINWCASLKPQHFVREEWAYKFGLKHFISPEFESDLNRVYDRIGATTSGIKHNRPNQLLLEGCQKLGYHVADVPQNTSGRSHECNFCFYGCKHGVKNSTTNTWLRDASANGAQFLDQTQVTRVLVENKKAVGVECVRDNQRFEIRAQRVVVAGGTVNTPGLLKRSGLTNKHIGRHLRLHPATCVYGVFDTPINMHEGSILTTVSNVADNSSADGYGAKIEVPCQHAASFLALMPWRGSLAHKQMALKYRHVMPLVVIGRDKDSKGEVYDNARGEPCVTFHLSRHDRKTMVTGMDRAINILVASGAREIYTLQYGIEPFVFHSQEESRIDNPRFIQWRQDVARYGLPGNGISGIFSAHQMGTCRLGISPKASATQPTGETWEVKDLYVADASLFPSASGVNPMVTIEAVALHVATGIAQKKKSKL
ncbi:hypothetical protein BJV82DRAFT_599460 [Fennellomyces sp. T-0311]|nr:hypothetical protein BJV82DRAFT_599460 [Fennellomyces sp. T-0311]